MKASCIAALIACTFTSCDGGGAEVNLNQSQGQDQRPDGPDFEPTPIEPPCEVRCNRRFDGLVEVLTTCRDGTRDVQILPSLPHNCDTVNDVFPVAESTPGGGVSGQGTK